MLRYGQVAFGLHKSLRSYRCTTSSINHLLFHIIAQSSSTHIGTVCGELVQTLSQSGVSAWKLAQNRALVWFHGVGSIISDPSPLRMTCYGKGCYRILARYRRWLGRRMHVTMSADSDFHSQAPPSLFLPNGFIVRLYWCGLVFTKQGVITKAPCNFPDPS